MHLLVLVWITHRQRGILVNEKISQNLTWLIRGALLVIFMQLFLGGWTSTNYAALACTDFPTCHGVLVPAMDHAGGFHLFRELGEGADGKPLTLEALTAIQWTHRIGALIVALYMGLLSFCLYKHKAFRPIAILLALALTTQIIIGIGNLVLYLPLLLAVAHNLGASLLLVIIVVLNSKITQFKPHHH